MANPAEELVAGLVVRLELAPAVAAGLQLALVAALAVPLVLFAAPAAVRPEPVAVPRL